jgi:transaldolase
MKIFLDSANLDEIRSAVAAGSIDGLTTNPSLLAREHVDLDSFLAAVCEIVPGPVSAPVRATDPEAIVSEARTLARRHDRLIAKIPITTAGLQAMARLHGEGIRTHATLCCSAAQALLAARAGAHFVSPLVGRLEEHGEAGLEIVSQIVDIYDNYDYDTQIVVASIKKPQHVLEAARLGADGVTVPKRLLDELVRHPLTDSIQRAFLADWEGL